MQRIFADRHKTGQLDLEAAEMAIRSTVHRTGADAVTELLRLSPPDDDRRSIPCTCGRTARYEGMRSRPILTVVGWARIDRPYYLCPACQTGQFPADVELDIGKTDFSPGVRRMLAAAGGVAPFAQGRDQMKILAGLEVTAKSVERTAESIGEDIEVQQQKAIQSAKQLCLPTVAGPSIPYLYIQMDGTQVFVVKSETEGRAGRTPGQLAHTRECKLGAVFTQTAVDDRGRPVRDEDSTTYVGAIETAEEFGLRIYTEAWNRGWDRATLRVVMGDGSHWIWNNADQHFPGAIQIVDLYHAREHLWDLARKLNPADQAAQKRWLMPKLNWLENGNIEKLAMALRKLADAGLNSELAKASRIEAEYFDNNRNRMRYPEFREKKLFVGSGVIEAGCKTVIGSRLKQSGMFWTVRGANAIIALRCCLLNGEIENYWAARRIA
ncbi:MAG: ISKra4 family transposase [Bryobacteraceae bacterium]